MSFKNLALSLTLAAATSAVAAPITWSVNGHDYQVVQTGSISWDDSRAAAQAIGAGWDLATITSMDEQMFIAGLLGPANGSLIEYYIGGTYSTSQGWHWETGEAFSFTYWGVGEPNNNINEPHIALDGRMQVPNWGWNDYTGDAAWFVNGYVAESSTAAVPEPTTIGLMGLGLAGLAFAARRKRA